MSPRRQRVQRGSRIAGAGARPARTSSSHQLTPMPPVAAQVVASISATSASASGIGNRTFGRAFLSACACGAVDVTPASFSGVFTGIWSEGVFTVGPMWIYMVLNSAPKMRWFVKIFFGPAATPMEPRTLVRCGFSMCHRTGQEGGASSSRRRNEPGWQPTAHAQRRPCHAVSGCPAVRYMSAWIGTNWQSRALRQLRLR